VNRPLGAIYLGFGAYFAGAYLFVVWHTLPYPYLLDWLEGGTVDAVARVAAGLPLYVEPSVDYVAFNYPPLYYKAAALVARFTGPGLLAPRLTSLLASLAIAALVWRFIRREGGSRAIAGIGVALFLAAFEPTGQWYHLARLDSFFLLLLLAGFYLLRFAPGAVGATAAGAALGLAFFAKQTALMATLPALAVLALADWRRALLAGVGFAAVAGAGVAILNAASSGWFGYFAFTVPAAGGNDWLATVSFWSRDIGRIVLPASLAAGVLLWLLWRRDRKAACFYAGMLAGMLLCGWLGRMHMGGWRNALMPPYTVLMLLLPLALDRVLRDGWPPMAANRARTVTAHGVILAQLVLLLADPWDSIPTAADRTASQALVEFLRGVDGEVLVMSGRHLPGLAGKRTPGLDMPVTDVLKVDDAVAAKLRHSIVEALHSGRFAGVVDPPAFVREQVSLGPRIRIPDIDLPASKYHTRAEVFLYYPVAR